MLDDSHLDKLLEPVLTAIIQHTHDVLNPAITGWTLITRAESLTHNESEYNIYTDGNNSIPETLGLIEIGKTLLIATGDEPL